MWVHLVPRHAPDEGHPGARFGELEADLPVERRRSVRCRAAEAEKLIDGRGLPSAGRYIVSALVG